MEKNKIVTARLVLRKVAFRDVLNIYREFNEKVTTYMMRAPAKNVFGTVRVVCGMLAKWRAGEEHVFAITLKSGGTGAREGTAQNSGMITKKGAAIPVSEDSAAVAAPSAGTVPRGLAAKNGEFLGLVGLQNLKRDVPTLGIWTKLSAHGHGYGREAIGGVIEFAKFKGYRALLYDVDRRNTASKKIPIFYGGVCVSHHEETARTGRVLELEDYRIPIEK